jgi:hypothetical protein
LSGEFFFDNADRDNFLERHERAENCRGSGIMGVHRMTVFNRMRKYGITLKNNI